MPVTAAALMRAFGGRWAIVYHADLAYWSAERCDGTAVRLLCAHQAWQLAARIEAAEGSDNDARATDLRERSSPAPILKLPSSGKVRDLWAIAAWATAPGRRLVAVLVAKARTTALRRSAPWSATYA